MTNLVRLNHRPTYTLLLLTSHSPRSESVITSNPCPSTLSVSSSSPEDPVLPSYSKDTSGSFDTRVEHISSRFSGSTPFSSGLSFGPDSSGEVEGWEDSIGTLGDGGRTSLTPSQVHSGTRPSSSNRLISHNSPGRQIKGSRHGSTPVYRHLYSKRGKYPRQSYKVSVLTSHHFVCPIFGGPVSVSTEMVKDHTLEPVQ